MLPIDDLRKTLVKRRLALFEQVVRVEDNLRWLDDNIEPEVEEEGQEENIARLLARLDDRGKAEIAAIDAALRRIATGEYGYCQRCGERIALARLLVIPTATACVDCSAASEHERA